MNIIIKLCIKASTKSSKKNFYAVRCYWFSLTFKIINQHEQMILFYDSKSVSNRRDYFILWDGVTLSVSSSIETFFSYV